MTADLRRTDGKHGGRQYAEVDAIGLGLSPSSSRVGAGVRLTQMHMTVAVFRLCP